MPSRSGPNPPIPPHSNPGFSGLLPSIPSSNLTTGRSLRQPFEPHDASNMSKLNGDPSDSSYRRGHHRSISHPFTAFTGLGKKRDKAAPKNDKYDKGVKWDSDSDSDEVTYPVQPISSSPRKDSTKAGPTNGTAEAKCGTCNSTVRWPQHLNVFRCSDCLMVTDLEPEAPGQAGHAGHSEMSGRGHRDRGDPPSNSHFGSSPKEAHVPFAPPEYTTGSLMSANRLGGMIDGCLSKYLDSVLDGTQHTPPHEENRPGRFLSPTAHDGTVLPKKDSRDGRLPSRQDPRSRSTSASSEHGRMYGTKEKPNFSMPNPRKIGDKPLPDLPIRNRANSDLRSQPRGERRPSDTPRPHNSEKPEKEGQTYIFKRVENYLITSFKGSSVMNNSFPMYQTSIRSASSGNPPRMKMDHRAEVDPMFNVPVFEPDAKTLLLGDVAENSTWWMTEWAQAEGQIQKPSKDHEPHKSRSVSSRSPRVNWAEVSQWYHFILSAGSSWSEQWNKKKPNPDRSEADRIRAKRWEAVDPALMEKEIMDSRMHLQRTLMKATENLLKRPRCILKKPEDTRFLFILLANPLLSSPSAYSQSTQPQAPSRDDRRPSHPSNYRKDARDGKPARKDPVTTASSHSSSNNHYGILKRILGLLANLPNDAHHIFISWFSRFSPKQFEKYVELISGFVNYRLTRQHGRKRSQVAPNAKDGDELVPSFASAAGNTPAELHAAINRRSPQKKPVKKKEAPIVYAEDWQIRAAARIMSLLFAANNNNHLRRPDGMEAKARRHAETGVNNHARQKGYMVPISSFYNTLLDYSDLIGDFEIWESKSSKFCFCRYPFFLSIWAKIRIMEHDARRQMEVKAREAFFNSILNHQAVSQHLVLKVRRECLVEDSLRGVSEVVGAGEEEIKKGLRIEFVGEEGIDVGGLRKEWFLLLVREVFDPDHGLFIYDEDSQYCYFNPYCFESSEQFFLVGVLLGLAIYNSTILDIDLPPFAFRKLLSTAPQMNTPQTANSWRSRFKFTLEDLAEYRPVLARGLRALLEFDGDVAETFCYDFVAQVDRYGEVVNIPLCPGGENRAVNNDNRGEFVELYVHYLLETSVARQFEPFKRGFFTVCGGNALSLFRPEEIELLVRGSDEPLDVLSLRAVATYDNWQAHRPESLPVVQWFWEFFENAPPDAQRKVLSFITGSDRIPAMGATSLSIRLACMGDDCSRYPIARTCFNTIGLYRYTNKDKFRKLLWDAVVNSEGFGLK